MASDLEQLVLSIGADTRQIQRALKKLEGDTNASTKRIERQFDGMGKKVGRSFDGLGNTARALRVGLAGLAGAFVVREAQRLIDSATRIDNALKVAGLSGEELEKVYSRLRDSAVKNAAPIEALVELYGRVALVQKELGISGDELSNFTDKIAVALRVSGKSAAESTGALLQLSQALGSGVVRAEEFNSILEGALPIAQAAAAGLREAGGSVAKLRQLIVGGEVSSEAFFRAFEAGSVILEDKVADATFTVAQATGNLGTALIDVAREFNASTGAGERFADGINSAAEAIADFDVSGFIDKIEEARSALERFLNEAGNADIFKWLNDALGQTDGNGNVLNLSTEEARREAEALEREIELLQATIANNTALAVDNTEALARLNEVSGRLAQLKSEISSLPVLEDVPGFVQPGGGGSTRGRYRNVAPRTVSLGDFDPPDDGKKKKKGGRKDRANEFEREIEQIKERTAAVQAETSAMAGLNPLIDDYGFALEKARSTQDLLTAAQKAGIAVTPELRAKIDELATGYANASVEAEKLAEAQDKARQTAEEMRDLGKDVMGGFIHDLIEGKSAADALADALGKIGDKLLDMAMNSLFGGSGSSGLGILGSLLGFGGGSGFSPNTTLAGFLGVPGYASGTNFHPGGMAIVGEKGPELLNLPRGSQVIPNIPQIPKLAAANGNGGVVVHFSPVIDNRGASVEAVARNEQQLAKMRAELPAMVVAAVRKSGKSNVKLG